MKDKIDKFYRDNEPLLNLLGVAFIISGLLLNVPSANGLIGEVIEQLKFFFLALSSTLLIYSIIRASQFLSDLLNAPEQNSYQLIKKLAITIFSLSLVLLIFSDLIIFIIVAFPHESIYLGLVILSFLFIVLPSKIVWTGDSNKWKLFFRILLTLLLIIPLLGGYIFLFFNDFRITFYLILGVVLISLILYLILQIKSRKTPILGDKDNPTGADTPKTKE